MGLKNLFRPDYRSRDPEVRLKALNEIEDQSLLTEMAMTDTSPRVRKAAVKKITDQDRLFKIALDGNGIEAGIAAVEKIDSQEKIAEIIKARKNYRLIGACFAQISDKNVLCKIANNPEYSLVARRIAIENYADESLLADWEDRFEGQHRQKSREEIETLMKKYGGVQLVRTLGKFRGSKSAILALGEIIRMGGEPAAVAIEYLAQALEHANPDVSRIAGEQLIGLSDADLIARLIGMIDNTDLDEKIMAVLEKIDHPEARQIVKKSKGK